MRRELMGSEDDETLNDGDYSFDDYEYEEEYI